MNCPVVRSLFHSSLPAVSRGCCLGTVLPATMLCQPGLGGRSSFCGLYGIPFLRTLALMLHRVGFPVRSSQFLRRGGLHSPWCHSFLQAGLVVQPGPLLILAPIPGPLAGWGLAVPLSPCVFYFNRRGESSPNGSKLELPRWPAQWWIPQDTRSPLSSEEPGLSSWAVLGTQLFPLAQAHSRSCPEQAQPTHPLDKRRSCCVQRRVLPGFTLDVECSCMFISHSLPLTWGLLSAEGP